VTEIVMFWRYSKRRHRTPHYSSCRSSFLT